MPCISSVSNGQVWKKVSWHIEKYIDMQVVGDTDILTIGDTISLYMSFTNHSDLNLWFMPDYLIIQRLFKWDDTDSSTYFIRDFYGDN